MATRTQDEFPLKLSLAMNKGDSFIIINDLSEDSVNSSYFMCLFILSIYFTATYLIRNIVLFMFGYYFIDSFKMTYIRQS